MKGLSSQAKQLRHDFQEAYGSTPQISFAPGRVNLIGDHIDYVGGTVLPMPIQQGTWVAAGLNDSPMVRAQAVNLQDRLEFVVGDMTVLPQAHWGRFVQGAVAQLQTAGCSMHGVDLIIYGNIPGGGLSSSASLSLALLQAIAYVHDLQLPALQMALMAQQIEHQHIGVMCGLMDQAVIAFGQPRQALLFDCATHAATAIEIDPEQCAVVIADSGMPRTLAGSAYNERRAELRQVAAQLRLDESQLARQVPADFVLDDAVLAARARHVRSEQQRVMAARQAIAGQDWPLLGQLLQHSHASLARDYAVSCDELDVLVDLFSDQQGCWGARMTGAGFGGCVVAVVEPAQVRVVMDAVKRAYQQRTGLRIAPFVAHSEGGVRMLA